MYSLYIMGALYIVLGILHFTHTGYYRPLMPMFLPTHNFLIYLSGIAEVLLGLGVFFPKIRSLALWGIIAMLIVFLLLVHVNMLFPGNRLGVPLWILIMRIPLQFFLIYWAYQYLR